jgi:Arm DNA-binding domain
MRHVLTSTYLESIKPPAVGRVEIADLRCAGLAYRITASGARSWCYRFRDPQTGRPSRATIGGYPTVSLAKARAQAEALRREVARGNNPVAAKRQARAEADTKMFRALAERYMAEHSRRHKRSADADERNLRKHLLPAWGARPFESIGRRDVIEIAEKLVTAGKPVLANRVQALVSSIFSFAIDADLVQANPAARLRRRGVERRKTRVLTMTKSASCGRAVSCRPSRAPWVSPCGLRCSPACGQARSPASRAPKSNTSTILSGPR